MRTIDERQITDFARHLEEEERAEATIKTYVRTVEEFMTWLVGRSAAKELAVAWKEYLTERDYAPATVNVKLAAVNAFFKFRSWHDCCVKALRLQWLVFRDPGRGLTKAEYQRLVEAALAGRAEIALKGKIRTIMLPGKLCRKLLKYAKNKRSPPARYFSPEVAAA